MELAALVISIFALAVAGVSARYSRQQATEVARQNSLQHDAVLRIVELSDGGADDEHGVYVQHRRFLAIENLGNGRAREVTIAIEMDRAGRTYGVPKTIPVLEPHSFAEIRTERPLPLGTQLWEPVGDNDAKIEHAEVRWIGSDGKKRTKRLPLVFG